MGCCGIPPEMLSLGLENIIYFIVTVYVHMFSAEGNNMMPSHRESPLFFDIVCVSVRNAFLYDKLFTS